MNRQRTGIPLAGLTALLAAWVLLCGGSVLHNLTPHHPSETGAEACSICKTSEGNSAYPVPEFTVHAPAPASAARVPVLVAVRTAGADHTVAAPRAPPLPA